MKNGAPLTLMVLVLFASVTQGSDLNHELNPEIKSLLYPGWGQIANGSTTRGIILIGLETVALGMITYHSIEGEECYQKYRDAPDAETAIRMREQTYHHDKKRNLYIGIGAAIWIYNIFDIYYFFSPDIDSTNRMKESPVQLYILPDGGFQFRCSFYL